MSFISIAQELSVIDKELKQLNSRGKDLRTRRRQLEEKIQKELESRQMKTIRVRQFTFTLEEKTVEKKPAKKDQIAAIVKLLIDAGEKGNLEQKAKRILYSSGETDIKRKLKIKK